MKAIILPGAMFSAMFSAMPVFGAVVTCSVRESPIDCQNCANQVESAALQVKAAPKTRAGSPGAGRAGATLTVGEKSRQPLP
jgi:hypothetical protein